MCFAWAINEVLIAEYVSKYDRKFYADPHLD